ncbi:hypothetical protein IIC68_02690 [archaeon]|nr:hypothetical protein [archaeon]
MFKSFGNILQAKSEKQPLSEGEVKFWSDWYEANFSPEEKKQTTLVNFLSERNSWEALSQEEKTKMNFSKFLYKETSEIEKQKEVKE